MLSIPWVYGSNAPYSKIGDPNKKMDRLSARHKSLYDRFEMGQTSEAEEQRMYRLEDRMDKVGKRIKKKESPASMDPKKSMQDEAKVARQALALANEERASQALVAKKLKGPQWHLFTLAKVETL